MKQIDHVLNILDKSFLNKEFLLLDNENFDFAKGSFLYLLERKIG